MDMRVGVAGLLALLVATSCAPAQEQLISSFESEADLAQWDAVAGEPRLVSEHETHGERALELTFDPDARWSASTLQWRAPLRDWSAWDAIIVDVFNPMNRPVRGSLLVADQAWADGGRSYWNRHNSSITFAPGPGRWVIPVHGLYRGEAGSRNNDIKRDIDTDQIVRLDLNFGANGETGQMIVDNIRFVAVGRPAGVHAFDFGPPSQPTMLAWTGVSHETAYTPEAGYGWGPRGGTPWSGADRDTTFGTMLTRDFCEAGGYNFTMAVPTGEYEVLVIYENSGYWGGEQAKHSERTISVDGETVWSQSRPDGAATALYRFEDVEPVGADLWEAYMAAELAQSVRFTAQAGDDGLTLRFEADQTWGSKISALAIHRVGDDEAARWLDGQMASLADEFRANAVNLDPEPLVFDVSQAWEKRGLVAWSVRISETVAPYSTPDELASPGELTLTAEAVRGEYEPVSIAIRPLADLGECEIALEGVAAEGVTADTRVVWYNTSRGFGTIAYRVLPHTLRPQGSVDLSADLTRQIVVTFDVAEDAAPGVHRSTLRVTAPGGEDRLSVPVELTVHDVALSRETEFLMGFFGLMPPGSLLPGDASSEALVDSLAILREHGMNALSGGPSWQLTGWQDGVPQVDFGEVDGFFALCREHGFSRAVNGYGGLRFRGLHDRYIKGAAGERVERDSGLDYPTAMMRAWQATDEHARANDWPTIFYAMCDETRVADRARRELEFMRMMAEVSARFPETVRTSGSYSVHFRERPTDESDLLLWHQRFFEALDVNSLNSHDQSVMDEAERQGKQVHIYNQGRDRFTFGLYQWREFQAGVAARWQWHFNILHGYQFFDLDGREPDNAMVAYGRDTLYPTMHFERCREGAEDFYLYQTLADAIAANEAAGRKPQETQVARDLLRSATESVALNQRTPPEGFDPLRLKREVIAALTGMR